MLRTRLQALERATYCRLPTRVVASALRQAGLMLMQALRAPIGEQLRSWRERRQLSQLELSLAAEVSARHLSFVENGRAQPGRDLILRLAKELDVPLRDRNALLVSAGFAPVFRQRRFDDPSFDPVRAIITATLETHKPFPAYVIDRHWSVVASNSAIPELFEEVAPELLIAPINVVRLILHPRGIAPRLLNFSTWRRHYLAQLRRQIALTGDPVLEELYRDAASYPGQRSEEAPDEASVDSPAIAFEVMTRLGRLSFLSATTVFGSPADVTLEEIALELLYPANPFTAQVARDHAGISPDNQSIDVMTPPGDAARDEFRRT
jgi:transcriptional regulator with XRE-family HTH domain